MWRADQLGMCGKRIIRPGDRFLIEHIDGGHTGSSGIETRQKRTFLDQPGTRGVDQHRPRLHHRQISRGHHAARRRLQAHMQADNIAVGKEGLPACRHLPAVGSGAGAPLLASPDHHGHAKGIGIIRNLLANPAIAENADLPAMRRPADTSLPPTGTKACHLPWNIAKRRQHQRPCHFRRRM